MMGWLARLKNQKSPDPHPTKTTKTVSVVSVGYPQGHFQKSDACSNDPKLIPTEADPDRWCWPNSDAMNGAEIATFNARGALFTRRGLTMHAAERQADKLVQRDRGDDDRRLCVECQHLRGTGLYRCGNARAAGMHADLARDLVLTLQRCPGFAAAALPEDAPAFVAPPEPDPAPAPDPLAARIAKPMIDRARFPTLHTGDESERQIQNAIAAEMVRKLPTPETTANPALVRVSGE